MGLASALSTALTGMSAAETTIDIVGNNLANADTVGFKQSNVNFATQFLQTMSLGSAPGDTSGGTNPTQVGLGTMAVEITPDFSQGTIQTSSSTTDLAIQGDGFFIVEGDSGAQFYTRDGSFKLNSQNELVTVTGERVLGYGVDENFELDTSSLEAIQIPLGSAAVAQATENVYLEGQLSSSGDVADTAEQIETSVLGNGYYTAPTDNGTASLSTTPNIVSAGTEAKSHADGDMTEGTTYEYCFVYASEAYSDTSVLSESCVSETVSETVATGDGSVELTNIPSATSAVYSFVRIYRRAAGDTDFHYINELSMGTDSYVDSMSDDDAKAQSVLDEMEISGNYKYYATFADATGGPGSGTESRTCLEVSAASVNVVNGRVVLTDLPEAAEGDGWVACRIYRSLADDDSTFYYVGEVAANSGASITDNVSDEEIATRATLDFDGPTVLSGTKLTDVLLRNSSGYEQLFHEGTLSFTGSKGGTSLDTKEFTVTSATTVQDLIDFMTQALGIQSVGSSLVDGSNSTATPGGTIDADGHIILTGNNGVDNAIAIKLSSLSLTYTEDGVTQTKTIDMGWTEKQAAVGDGAVTDTVVYDSLGDALSVRITMVLESRSSSETTYRWFADSSDNSSGSTAKIAVGTGTVSFDTSGNFLRADQDTVAIYRDGYPTVNPLTFALDFSAISGLSSDTNTLSVTQQDGSAAGTLTSYIIGNDGIVTGVFSNGISRTLAQIRLARFANPNGLEQVGQNLYAAGVNSGLPILGNPGTQGIGSLVSGAVELSNTDIGSNLIDLILASTMYRGNSRVITTIQDMFDELMSLRR